MRMAPCHGLGAPAGHKGVPEEASSAAGIHVCVLTGYSVSLPSPMLPHACFGTVMDFVLLELGVNINSSLSSSSHPAFGHSN